MPQELEELPLFPLNTVVFPYASFHLHIFEPRYREMIARCLDEDRPFGIVLIREGNEVGDVAEPYMVGTVVRITQTHRYEDGRMDIQVQGERRFRIRNLDDESKPYLVARVEPVEEGGVDSIEMLEDLMFKAREEFEKLIKRAMSQQNFNIQIVFPPDPMVLSFTIANMVEMPLLSKQRLLETTDTTDRFDALIPLLERQLSALMDSDEEGPGFEAIHAKDLQSWVSPN